VPVGAWQGEWTRMIYEADCKFLTLPPRRKPGLPPPLVSEYREMTCQHGEMMRKSRAWLSMVFMILAADI